MTNPTSFWSRCWSAARAFARPELMIALLIIGAALATPSIAMQGDTIADRVLGQFDFVHNSPNLVDASGMWSPLSLAIDSSVTPNRLYVSDYANSRVLGYKNVATFVNGGAADLVIGQPDFISGQSSAFSFGCNEPERHQPVRSDRGRGGSERQSLRGGFGQQPRGRIQHPVRRMRFVSVRWRARQPGVRAGRQL